MFPLILFIIETLPTVK